MLLEMIIIVGIIIIDFIIVDIIIVDIIIVNIIIDDIINVMLMVMVTGLPKYLERENLRSQSKADIEAGYGDFSATYGARYQRSA